MPIIAIGTLSPSRWQLLISNAVRETLEEAYTSFSARCSRECQLACRRDLQAVTWSENGSPADVGTIYPLLHKATEVAN